MHTVDILSVSCSVIQWQNYNTFPAFQQDILLFDYLHYTLCNLIRILVMHFRLFPEQNKGWYWPEIYSHNQVNFWKIRAVL